MSLKVKEVCKQKGITITQLAEKLNIKQESLSRAINGNPTLETMQKIASALDIPITELFENSNGNVFQFPKCGNDVCCEAKNQPVLCLLLKR